MVVTLFQEELQKIGTFITSTGYQLLSLGKYSSRSLKRVMLKQQKPEAKGLRNGGNAG